MIPSGSQNSKLCLEAPIGRYRAEIVVLAGADSYTLDLEDTATGGPSFGLPNPPGGSIQAGGTWAFMNWTRNAPGAARFSIGLQVLFIP